jgi:hypothetical protein
MGGACCTYRGAEKCIHFWWVNLNEGDHLEGLGVSRRVILKWILN